MPRQKKESTCSVGGLAPRSSGIGDVASSNAVSHQKKQSTWGVWPPSTPCPEKKTIHLRRWWFGSVFAAALAMFPPSMQCPSKKNNQPAALLASTTRRQKNSTGGIGGLASHSSGISDVSSMPHLQNKQGGIAGLL